MVNPQSAHAGAGPPFWTGLAPRARQSGADPPTCCRALNRSRAAAARLAPARAPGAGPPSSTICRHWRAARAIDSSSASRTGARPHARAWRPILAPGAGRPSAAACDRGADPGAPGAPGDNRSRAIGSHHTRAPAPADWPASVDRPAECRANGAARHWRCGAASQSAPVALIGGYSTNWRVPRRAAPIGRPDPGAQRRAGGTSSPRRTASTGSSTTDPRSTNWPTPIAPIGAIGTIHWIIYPPRG